MDDLDIAAVMYGTPSSKAADPATAAAPKAPSSKTIASAAATAASVVYEERSSKTIASADTPIAPAVEEAITNALYAKEPEPVALEIPDAIKALRATDNAMFDPTAAYSTAITEEDFGVDAEVVIAPEVKAAAIMEFRAMFADIGLPAPEAREVVDIAKQIGKDVPTPEQESAWTQDAAKRLLDTNGGDLAAANADLALAKALVQRDPRLKKVLEVTRLGSHPRVVELVVQRARSEKMRGRL
jgi:hypothetical protein